MVECPYTAGQIWMVDNWLSVKGSIDYFDTCGMGGYAIPSNLAGNQLAFHGNSYVGLAPWAKNLNNAREFLGVELTETLNEGHRYKLSLRLSMADSVSYAVREIGVVFTESQPSNDLMSLFGLNPQILFQDSTSFSSQVDWMHLGGAFISNGTEQFLTIGNFLDDTETDTLLISNQISLSAYYYIDSVSLIEDTTWRVGISELGYNELEVYPNPNSGRLTIDIPDLNGSHTEIGLHDLAGKLVARRRLYEGINTLEFQTQDGLYLYVVSVDGVQKWSGKIAVSKY
jgi:hypothetical protein